MSRWDSDWSSTDWLLLVTQRRSASLNMITHLQSGIPVCLSVCLSLCLSVCLSLCINVSLCLWVLVKPPPQKLGLYVRECDSVFVFVWSVYMSGTRLIGPTVLAAGPAMSDLSTAGQLGQCPTLWPVVRCAHWKTQRRQWSRPLLSVTWTAVTRCATASTTNWHATCSQFRMLSPGSWRTPGDVIVFRLCSASCTGFLCSSASCSRLRLSSTAPCSAMPGLHGWQQDHKSGTVYLRICRLSHGQFRRLLKTFLFGQLGHGAVWTVF